MKKFNADWDKRLPKEIAKNIVKNGVRLSEGGKEKDCYWSGYKKYDPQYVYDYINKMHKAGWEKRKFDDAEWVLSHEYFSLKDVDLDDTTIKWNFGQHPPVVSNYSKLETEIPPIVIGSNGYIIDGTHRAGAAKMKGDKTIKAYVGVNF